MSRQVIINADDFGLSPAVNSGIVKAYQAGGITSTSMMVNMPGFGDALRLARLLPGLGVGLHFNLTYGVPVSDPGSVPSLVRPDGSFHDVKSICNRDVADVEKELEAQWQRFVETSLFPTHLDSHHLLHQNDPFIYKVMATKAVKENVPLRRSQIVHPFPDLASPRMTDSILLDTYGDAKAMERLFHYLRSLPEGITEIVCHPGHVDEILRTISEWTDIRERELSVFADQEVVRVIKAFDIIPINFKALKIKPFLSEDHQQRASRPEKSLTRLRHHDSIGRHSAFAQDSRTISKKRGSTLHSSARNRKRI
ncbi:carbohydrate deacetylase [Paenibacillus azoreducens]|uniref:Carbohydrate deacetylase n=1 Tax=Paenibacillus azoreducens TaxID=116718 RepID=A0A919YGN9_9BACL|nr:ChbG/HpnK family deacetylase [Paenibacillus azoreducens]GIO50419.1 hypothetical protein J34TS1_51840 [Paenibacillus azoreducens]